MDDSEVWWQIAVSFLFGAGAGIGKLYETEKKKALSIRQYSAAIINSGLAGIIMVGSLHKIAEKLAGKELVLDLWTVVLFAAAGGVLGVEAAVKAFGHLQRLQLRQRPEDEGKKDE